MKIGLLHFRVGETDGVSLEMEKWKTVLQRSGHEVFYVAGSLGNQKGFEVPLLAYEEPRNLEIKKLAFESLEPKSEKDLKEMIFALKEEIKSQLEELPKFDIVIGNNIWSLGHNLSAAIALYEYAVENNVKLIGHHHDFYFERDYYSTPTSPFVEEILDSYFPPNGISHITINSLAQMALKKRKSFDSVIVPNVFDFKRNLWEKDAYNSRINEILKINPNDIVFLQATRVVRRKAIEMAIDVLSEVNRIKCDYYGVRTSTGKIIEESSEFVLLLPGLNEEISYKNAITKHAKAKGVKLVFASELCTTERMEENGTFSLWDFYAISDFVTYPSVKEGFGNQFLEAIFAKKPMLIFEYPVYVSDIKKVGFKVVSLGDKAILKNGLFEVESSVLINSAKKIMRILADSKLYTDMVETNFLLGKDRFSYEVLQRILDSVIKNIR